MDFSNPYRYIDEEMEVDKEEQERLEDLRERDEFAQRLKNRDKDSTKKVRSGLHLGVYFLLFQRLSLPFSYPDD